MHRYDAEIKLLIENEIELATEIETNLLFDEKVSVAIARCVALIDYLIKEHGSKANFFKFSF